MKKNLFFAVVAFMVALSGSAYSQSKSNSYQTSGGLFLDLGNGGTYVGPHIKHYFNGQDAAQVMVLFGNDLTIIGAEYSYNKAIPNAAGLNWNIGIGPQGYFGKGDYNGFLLRPQAGLEYKVPNAPLAAGFDWRPMWELTHGSEFEAGRFGLSFKYVFK